MALFFLFNVLELTSSYTSRDTHYYISVLSQDLTINLPVKLSLIMHAVVHYIVLVTTAHILINTAPYQRCMILLCVKLVNLAYESKIVFAS